MENDVAGHGHGVEQIPLNLVEYVLGWSTEQDSACFGVFAFGQEAEILVADFGDLKEAAVGADVGFLEVKDAVDDGSAGRAGDTVVVRLTDATEGGDVVLE